MEITIGPYKVSKRTEYSKLKIYNLDENKDITDTSMQIAKNIVDDYEKQISNKDDYFIIDNNSILGLTDKGSDFKYLFIPEGITKIGKSAFLEKDFSFVSLPDSITKIDDNAFMGCEHLESIELPNIDEIATRTFMSCVSLKNVIIPNTVEYIGLSAFHNCTSLQEIKLPRGLKAIEDFAFDGCNFSKINLPESLTLIEESVFFNCKKLEEVIIPDSVTTMGPRVFYGCTNLKYAKLSENILSIREGLFSGCNNLKSVILPDTIATLGNNIFEGVQNITTVNIPKNLTSIFKHPFNDCSVDTLIFNHDLPNLLSASPANNIPNLLADSNIYKLVISNNVKEIAPSTFGTTGFQITEIDYLGSKEEFKEFENNNKELFEKCLRNIQKLTFLERKIEDIELDDLSR